MQEVEARLDRVTGDVALTFNGDLVTSLVAGTGISMAVNSAGALTVTNSGSGTGDSGGNDFNTATFDSPIPNQTADSWAYARVASSITGGKSSKVDYHILKDGCSSNSKALKLAQKNLKLRKTAKRKIKT